MKRQITFLFILLITLLTAYCTTWTKQEYVSFQDSVKKIASTKALPAIPKTVIPEELKIISAKYGAKDKWIDVTEKLRNKVNENKLSIAASNNIAGDPLYGYPKYLEVEYILNGTTNQTRTQEGTKLEIPPSNDPSDALNVIETPQELITLTQNCPAEVGFYGVNFSNGRTIEYRGDQPACMASIVKIFALLEVMRQEDEGKLDLSESIVIERKAAKETCSVSEAIDKMIGISDNEATAALAKRVGYKNVNALAKKLSIKGLSDDILPEPGILEGVLDKRVHKLRTVPKSYLLPQHGTARGIVQYFKLLHERKLISKSISEKTLEAMQRNPKYFASRATPAEYRSVGKGGSIQWKRLFAAEYNMAGWGLYIYDKNEAIACCLWFECFPENLAQDERSKWITGLSESIVNLLLKNEQTAGKDDKSE